MEQESNLNANIKQESKMDKFPENFGNFLNAAALAVILVIIITFLYTIYNYKNIEIVKENHMAIEFKPTGNSKLDEEKFNKIVDLKLKEFKEEMKNSEKERNEDMKYYSALVGFILSIVGLFGFKSMYDTRQAAIEKAVFDAKKESEKIAQDVSEKKAIDVASRESKIVATDVSQKEVNKFLTENKEDIFRLLENPIRKEYDPIILEYKDRLDKLERPGIYNNDIKELNDKLSNIYVVMNERITKLEKELVEKELELLKLKG